MHCKDKLFRTRLYIHPLNSGYWIISRTIQLPDITVLAVTVYEVRLASGVCRAGLRGWRRRVHTHVSVETHFLVCAVRAVRTLVLLTGLDTLGSRLWTLSSTRLFPPFHHRLHVFRLTLRRTHRNCWRQRGWLDVFSNLIYHCYTGKPIIRYTVT